MYDRDVVEAPNFQSEMRQLLRDRIIDAGRRILVTEGWGAVNMSRLAKEVGVVSPCSTRNSPTSTTWPRW